MLFQSALETYREVYESVEDVRRLVEPYLVAALDKSSLATVDVTLRYVPIVMPRGMRERYPARSRLRKREKAYDCSPQLDYDIFLNGSFARRLDEYLRGLSPAGPRLAELGVSPTQMADFSAILARASLELRNPVK